MSKGLEGYLKLRICGMRVSSFVLIVKVFRFWAYRGFTT